MARDVRAPCQCGHGARASDPLETPIKVNLRLEELKQARRSSSGFLCFILSDKSEVTFPLVGGTGSCSSIGI
jgi:hypothetical protein